MVEVRPHGTYKQGFIVQGHAGYAPHGADVVCSAISAISQMVAHELHRLQVATREVESGYLSVINHSEGYAEDIISMLIRTLRLIEHQYPDHIKVYQEETE